MHFDVGEDSYLKVHLPIPSNFIIGNSKLVNKVKIMNGEFCISQSKESST